MTSTASARHWDDAYALGDTTRSWYQAAASPSLHVLDACDVRPSDSIVDVGGGASTLVDALVDRSHADVTVLDISAIGVQTAQRRLGARAAGVTWLVADVLTWRPERTYGVWHDRAMFHFLTDATDRARYLTVLDAATAPGSLAVFATFAPDGPDHCSGLPVERYESSELAALLRGWRPVLENHLDHVTPGGGVQAFTWEALRRT